jgi:hypothetical protein
LRDPKKMKNTIRSSDLAAKALQENLKTRSGPSTTPPVVGDLKARAPAPPPGTKPLGVTPTLILSPKSKILHDWR